MVDESVVSFRLIRADDAPATNPHQLAYEFGLQDTSEQLYPAIRLADGRLAFDFDLRVRPGKDGAPNFLGPFASGPPGERFVYLSWRSIPDGAYINRVKVRLGDLDWPTIHAAQAASAPLVADLTGAATGGGRRAVTWQIG